MSPAVTILVALLPAPQASAAQTAAAAAGQKLLQQFTLKELFGVTK